MNAVEKALVSIILPVYNAEDHLRTCMESVLRQTYSNLEFIVVDDGSTDQSVAVARSFQDDRVIVIEAEHRGVSHARNIGLENMTGQYFTFVDADDFVMDTYVEVMLSDIQKYEADIAFTRVEFHYQNEEFEYREATEEKCYIENNKKVVEACFGLDENRRGYNGSVYGRLYRMSFYDEIREQFDECLSYGEDAKWLFTITMRANRIVLNEKALYHYNRIRGKYTNYEANIRYYSWRLSFYKENGFPKQMIYSTECDIRNNQFALLMKEYPAQTTFKDRLCIGKRYRDLWLWFLTKQKPMNLGSIKLSICTLLMRFGFSWTLVNTVMKLQGK